MIEEGKERKNPEMNENSHNEHMDEAEKLLRDINLSENEQEPAISAEGESSSNDDTEKHIETEKQESNDILSKLGWKSKGSHGHKKEVVELKKQVEELNDKYLRLFAE